MMIVASSVGLAFLPAETMLRAHDVVHVFADATHVEWERKAGWLGDPVAAVVGFGHATEHPVSVVAAQAEVFAASKITPSVDIEKVADESIPSLGPFGRGRAQVVAPDEWAKIQSLGVAALAELLLPKAGAVGLKPGDGSGEALFRDAETARDVGPWHQLVAWQAFCAYQADVAAYRITRGNDDTAARKAAEEYIYYRWNLEQVDAALAVIPEPAGFS
ncbi:hypothetical protein [Mycobacterium talmoniae]|uniref:hypothetical protein n=1 Tax=Mycobacterium talmoniae TaxID=1858794 RepID=UPI0010591FDE|nr:hypothetical protein [Mycobacterium talmoniae]